MHVVKLKPILGLFLYYAVKLEFHMVVTGKTERGIPILFSKPLDHTLATFWAYHTDPFGTHRIQFSILLLKKANS